MKRILSCSALILLMATTRGEAAAHYVRQAAAGSATGADWANACTDFVGSCAVSGLVRGDTYYVAGGSYAARTFDKAASGTAVITIKGATVADHGTAAGWSDSYSVETSQAHWGSPIYVNSSYWTWDGGVGAMTSSSAAYGFIFDATNCTVSPQIDFSIGVSPTNGTFTDYVFRHIAFKACSQDIEKSAIAPHTQVSAWNNVNISYCLFDGWQGAWESQGTGQTNSNHTIEYNYFIHHFSSSAHHGEWIDVNNESVTNLVFRYNFVHDCMGTGCIVANNKPILSAAIYGNVFGNSTAGNGIVTSTSALFMQNVLVYNNTFYSSTGPWFGGCVSGASACASASGNVAYNNVVWNMAGKVGAGVGTSDYNAYFATSSPPTEPHGQISAANPFVNSAAGNFHLVFATPAGINLPSPYRIDPDGSTRGADSVWDRGAYEYSGTVTSAPSSPTNLRIIG